MRKFDWFPLSLSSLPGIFLYCGTRFVRCHSRMSPYGSGYQFKWAWLPGELEASHRACLSLSCFFFAATREGFGSFLQNETTWQACRHWKQYQGCGLLLTLTAELCWLVAFFFTGCASALALEATVFIVCLGSLCFWLLAVMLLNWALISAICFFHISTSVLYSESIVECAIYKWDMVTGTISRFGNAQMLLHPAHFHSLFVLFCPQ